MLPSDWSSPVLLAAPGGLFGDLLPWLLLLVLVVLAGGVVIFAARRLLRSDDSSSAGFTLHDLRLMHARGDLTDEEFERARTAMVGRVRDAMERDDSGRSDAPGTTGNQGRPSS